MTWRTSVKSEMDRGSKNRPQIRRLRILRPLSGTCGPWGVRKRGFSELN